MSRQERGPAKVPKVKSTVIPLDREINPDDGISYEVAHAVSEELLAALGRFAIDPDAVVFSGYDDSNNGGHARKAAGDHGAAEIRSWAEDLGVDDVPDDVEATGRHQYFFADQTLLTDNNGPLVYARSGEKPVVGVYNLETLRALGCVEVDGVVYAFATPEQVDAAKMLEFHLQYQRSNE